MMTTMTNNIVNNSFWNYIPSDELYNMDDLFSSTFDFIYHQEYPQDSISSNEQYEETPLYDTDLNMDITPMQSQIPNLICGVCGAPAHGYNFDQITCESCKAFFRRNALRETWSLRCRFSGNCVINVRTRRLCTYCRLKKCFDIKMRKDWIRTDEERELRQIQKLVREQQKMNRLSTEQFIADLPIVARKKKRLMVKPVIQQLVQPIFSQTFLGVHRNLSEEDQILFNNIINAHESIADKSINKSILPSTLSEFVNEESTMHTSLINFYKSIPEFKQLNIDDQVYFIKCNLIKIVHLHCILIEKFQENPVIGICMSKWLGEDFHYQMSRTRRYFDRFIEHPLILQLALIVLIFSTNLATSFDVSQSDDYVSNTYVCGIQDYYTTILWRYLNIIFDEKDAIRSMEIITTKILCYQTIMNRMEEAIRQQTEFMNQLESSLFRLT